MKIQNRKSKGSQFEYSIRDSLAQIYPDVLLSKQEGYVAQHDILIPSAKIKIECKRHKSLCWNDLEKYFEKLKKREPVDYKPLLIYKTNQQPCLVMQGDYTQYNQEIKGTCKIIMKFVDIFQVPYIEHNKKKKPMTAKDLLESGIIGKLAHRKDITNSLEYSKKLREEVIK